MSHEDERKSTTVTGATLIVWGVFAYMIPIVLVILDEAVFRTFFIYKTMPSWAHEIFKIVYYPLKMIFGK